MALIVEDGTGLSTAEAYDSVAGFKAYADKFGFSYSAFTDTQIEQFLRQGARHMVQKFRLRWKGTRTTSTQALDFPRAGVSTVDNGAYYSGQYVVDPNTVPDDIKNANNIFAQKASAGVDLFADGTQLAKREKIGQIEVEYEQGSRQRVQYDSVEAMLQPYLSSVGGISVPLVKG